MTLQSTVVAKYTHAGSLRKLTTGPRFSFASIWWAMKSLFRGDSTESSYWPTGNQSTNWSDCLSDPAERLIEIVRWRAMRVSLTERPFSRFVLAENGSVHKVSTLGTHAKSESLNDVNTSSDPRLRYKLVIKWSVHGRIGIKVSLRHANNSYLP